jgi:hypothetical protein
MFFRISKEAMKLISIFQLQPPAHTKKNRLCDFEKKNHAISIVYLPTTTTKQKERKCHNIWIGLM